MINSTFRKLVVLLAAFPVLLVMVACGLSVQVGNPSPAATQGRTPIPFVSPTSLPTTRVSPSATPSPAPATPASTPVALIEEVVGIPAPSLEGSLIKESDEQPVQVYLPPSYNHSSLRYPVVYFLPGFGSDPDGKNQDFSLEAIGSLMAEGSLKEMILVIPNGVNTLHGSFYVNSPVTGNWEDFIVKDVVGYIDSHYRTIPEASGRGISGHSMGGFAAIYLAMRHPDLFSAIYGLSPALFDQNGLSDSLMFDSPKKPENFQKQFQALAALSQPKAINEMSHYEGPLGFTVAYGAAFAPHADLGPPYFDYPYQLKNGQLQLLPDVWKRWESGFGDWPHKIAEYHKSLAGMKGIILDYGTMDFSWIRTGSVYLSQQLIESGIPNRIYAFEGTHTDHIEERLRTIMLPFFAEVLADPR